MPGSVEPLDVGVQIPYHFRCPISLELMCDPVTASTGQTYDRASIESWLATGNTTCPVTRVALTDFTFIPNHTLRRLIQEWCVANRSFGVERIPTPKQPADPATVRTLLSQASSESTHVNSRVSALRRLRGLARDSDKNRSVIAAHNAREVLLSIVFSNTDSDSSELNHESLAILSMFPLSESECAFVASDSERVGYLVSLLFHSSLDVRVNSAALIEVVVAGTRSPELRSQICNVDRIYAGIVGIFNVPLAHPRALKIGIKALFALCLVKQHRHKASAGDGGAPLPDPAGVRGVRSARADGAAAGKDHPEGVGSGDGVRRRGAAVALLSFGAVREGGGDGRGSDAAAPLGPERLHGEGEAEGADASETAPEFVAGGFHSQLRRLRLQRRRRSCVGITQFLANKVGPRGLIPHPKMGKVVRVRERMEPLGTKAGTPDGYCYTVNSAVPYSRTRYKPLYTGLARVEISAKLSLQSKAQGTSAPKLGAVITGDNYPQWPAANPEMCQETKGDLHVRVPLDSPHARMETSAVNDGLLAKPQGHDWVNCLVTNTAVDTYEHTPSCSLFSDKTTNASRHALS
ncbi:plant U-box 26 [Actinidia rufa]|uniref:U-box domain-containing protein n=1 Tax=Actinidia rufa TaxID=165716 RepID=A0A7J0EVG5_9ERIC|nr:plant U-box 26 [Actinidia rufa]